MPALESLRLDHADAILAFERENRDWFARSISDRGDAWFDGFAEQHRLLVAEQADGVGYYHVLTDEDGQVLGRFNLFLTTDGCADVGYRVGERAAGQGVATETLRLLCGRAASDYGLHTLEAAVSDANVASRRVLEKVGFSAVGPIVVAGKPGVRYRLSLTA